MLSAARTNAIHPDVALGLAHPAFAALPIVAPLAHSAAILANLLTLDKMPAMSCVPVFATPHTDTTRPLMTHQALPFHKLAIKNLGLRTI